MARARLLQHVLSINTPPATVSVVTLGDDNPSGMAARYFYQRFGFVPAEMTTPGPKDGTRQIFRLQV